MDGLPRRLTFGFASLLALLIDLAHELTVAEHADDFAPIFASMIWCFRQRVLQCFNSLRKRFQGQIINRGLR